MTCIFSASCATSSYNHLLLKHGASLPGLCRQQLQAFRFEEDAHRYLLGKLLLIKGMAWMGYTDTDLSGLKYTPFNKPYFDNNIHFNISHSGNYVLCAISDTSAVGIDLEEIKDINQQDLVHCFTGNEWYCINSAAKPTEVFYRFWTRKEAIIKADGRGLHIPLLSFEVIQDCVTIDSNKWHIQELAIDREYQAHFVSDDSVQGNYSFIELL